VPTDDSPQFKPPKNQIKNIYPQGRQKRTTQTNTEQNKPKIKQNAHKSGKEGQKTPLTTDD